MRLRTFLFGAMPATVSAAVAVATSAAVGANGCRDDDDQRAHRGTGDVPGRFVNDSV